MPDRLSSSATFDPSEYSFKPLGNDGRIELLRGVRNDGFVEILAMEAVSGSTDPEICAQLEHAYSLRLEFDGSFVALPRKWMHHAGRTLLVLDDPGGVLLESVLGLPMEPSHFLRTAIGIVDALDQFHALGFIHRDIKPGNFLVDEASGRAWLIGIGLTTHPRRQHSEPPVQVVGTFAYMAPEQTGRMNRCVDSRSDLYALGITFYQMLTGILPFTAADPMEWMHCHIAKQAIPPRKKLEALPEPVSDLVMKLLAKVPEERYQTAAGLAVDLRTCLQNLRSPGTITPFVLGQRDRPERITMHKTLYGREREIHQLVAAFDRVAGRGTKELV